MKTSNDWWKASFDSLYHKLFYPLFQEETKKEINLIIKHLKKINGHKILDIPCGYGRISTELAKLGFSVTGVDYSKDYIKMAKKTAVNGVRSGCGYFINYLLLLILPTTDLSSPTCFAISEVK